MTGFFSALLFRLCIGHILADFFLQKRSWVDERRLKRGLRSGALWKHSALHALFSGIACLGSTDPRGMAAVALAVLASHAVIDVLKSAANARAEATNGPAWLIFAADQALHFGVLVACAVAVSGGRSAEPLFGRAVLLVTDPRAGAVLFAYLLLSRPAGFFIGELTRAWREQLQNQDIRGLENAGLWIGILERWLLLTFLLLGNPGAVGFLIAAKSVFRFGSLTGSGELRKTEYILIGTMASVLFSLIVWIGLNAVLRRLP